MLKHLVGCSKLQQRLISFRTALPPRFTIPVEIGASNQRKRTVKATSSAMSQPMSQLDLCTNLMNQVYGPYSGADWTPRPYEDNKSRYLWTDAFGVVNYITLACETGEQHYLDQADSLINAVHNTLGYNRQHTRRLGNATAAHPTLGGLRIGKKDDHGSDCDGQYLHYITKWAFALNRMSLARQDPRYNTWAIELMQAVHPHFVHNKTPRLRSYWKISTDMSRPLVQSEGNLDPFDCLVTVRLLQRYSSDGQGKDRPLVNEERDFASMVEAKYKYYDSEDPLDLGEALWLSHWALSTTDSSNNDWAHAISKQSVKRLEELWHSGYFDLHEEYGRLAFREFGTTLGVQVNPIADKAVWLPRVDTLHRYWRPRVMHRDRDITPVMMAASLVPGCWSSGYDKL